MSPRRVGVSTTYKTRVVLEKPCKEHEEILIGQLTDSRVSSSSFNLILNLHARTTIRDLNPRSRCEMAQTNWITL
jgi:hypothetical protein